MSVRGASLCPRCRKQAMRDNSSTGEYFCSNCGFVSPHPFIDETSEYRQFALEHGVKNKSRTEFVGDDMVEDLGTGIQYDGSAKAKRRSLMNKRVTNDPQQAKLRKHVKGIRAMAGLLGVEKQVADSACKLYKEALDQKVTGTKKGKAIDAACLYRACYIKRVPRGMASFEHIIGDRVTARELQAAIDVVNGLPSLIGVVEEWEYLVKRYIVELKLPAYIENAAVDVGRKLREKEVLNGKNHETVMAGVLAYVTEKCRDRAVKRNIDDVSRIARVTRNTIEKRVEEIRAMEPWFLELPSFQEMMKQK